jgi:6-phosphogluconate dehydrogenase
MSKRKVGLIGLGVMGKNLSLNLESKGYQLVTYERISSDARDFMRYIAGEKNIIVTSCLEEFISNISPPRIIMLMIKAGKPVDETIMKLIPMLEKGDLVIDGGNSYFRDTIRRSEELLKKGILYLGTGISGGEEGALKGPAIMPGGQREAYKLAEEIFFDIAARAKDEKPCVSYIGPNGAGHFVKMVHNGIEYGDMQLIGETVWILEKALGFDAGKISDILFSWNRPHDILNSYLIEITGEIMKKKDEQSDEFLIDRIADITRMKGTGTWTVQTALELLVPIPTIAAAVFSREMSQEKDLRLDTSDKIKLEKDLELEMDMKNLIEIAHDALYISKISSYAQGFALMQSASKAYDFNLNLSNIARGWRAGCIIRAQFLDVVAKEYEKNQCLSNLIKATVFKDFIVKNFKKLAIFINIAHEAGVPVLAMDGAYDYITQITSPIMISAQIAALQRDYFGAHGYFRLKKDSPMVIKEDDGCYKDYHTEWMKKDNPDKKV